MREQGKSIDEIRAAEGIKHGGGRGGAEFLGSPLAHGRQARPGETLPVTVEKPGMPDPGRLILICSQGALRVADAGDQEGVIIISREAFISLAGLWDGTPFRGADRIRTGAKGRDRTPEPGGAPSLPGRTDWPYASTFPFEFSKIWIYQQHYLGIPGTRWSPAACTTGVPRPRSTGRTPKAEAAR